MEGATRLEVTIGAPVAVEVEGRELFLKRLQTQVEGNTLHITSAKKDWVSIGTSPRLTIRIHVPKLASLQVQGGNDVHLTGFNGGSTSIRLEGATNLHGSGRLDELTVFMAGAGTADLDSLAASVAKVTVAGVGNVTVHPEESLDATMNGIGAIIYTGSPRDVNTHVNGLGTIGQRDRKDRTPRNGAPPVEVQPPDPNLLQPENDENQQTPKATGVI